MRFSRKRKKKKRMKRNRGLLSLMCRCLRNKFQNFFIKAFSYINEYTTTFFEYIFLMSIVCLKSETEINDIIRVIFYRILNIDNTS